MRDRLKVTNLKEFKFHKSSDAHRRAFLAGLRSFDFVVRALAVNKTRLPLSFRKVGKLGFYAFFLNNLIQRIPASELVPCQSNSCTGSKDFMLELEHTQAQG